REEVARIVLAVHAVQHAAAVGVDEAAHELARKVLDDLRLPRRELDLALVLPSSAVLGEQQRPELRIAADFDATGRQALNADAIPRHHGLHGGGALGDDARIAASVAMRKR